MRIEDIILQLGNVGVLLETVETKGEQNLNNLLAAIQITRKAVKGLKEAAESENRNQQGNEL